MKEHQAPFPILIHILVGKIELGFQGTGHGLGKGDILSLDANIPHDLKATEDSVIRLTLSKQDKAERVREVIAS